MTDPARAMRTAPRSGGPALAREAALFRVKGSGLVGMVPVGVVLPARTPTESAPGAAAPVGVVLPHRTPTGTDPGELAPGLDWYERLPARGAAELPPAVARVRAAELAQAPSGVEPAALPHFLHSHHVRDPERSAGR